MPKPRHRLRYWSMAVFSVLIALLGLLLIVVGPDGETRRTGIMCVLFFGLGPLHYLAGPALTRSGPGTICAGRVDTSVGSEGAFVFPTPRSKTLALLASAIGLAGGSALLFIAEGGWVVGACAAVFGLFLVLAVYRALRPQRVAITPTRVVVNGTEIPWDVVDGVDLYEMPAGRTSVDMVGIDATDPDAIVRPGWQRVVGRLGRRLSEYDVVVGADSFAGSGESVVDALRLYRGSADRRRRIGDERELTQLRDTLEERIARA
jgi:hypothetical protein